MTLQKFLIFLQVRFRLFFTTYSIFVSFQYVNRDKSPLCVFFFFFLFYLFFFFFPPPPYLCQQAFKSSALPLGTRKPWVHALPELKPCHPNAPYPTCARKPLKRDASPLSTRKPFIITCKPFTMSLPSCSHVIPPPPPPQPPLLRQQAHEKSCVSLGYTVAIDTVRHP